MIYYVKKAVSFVLTLLFIAIISFILFKMIPGDSALAKLGTEATEEQIEAVREAEGLNDPVAVQFFRWIKGAVRGDFGMSSQYNVSAGELIGDRFPVTFGLGIVALVIIILISFPLGLIASRREDGLADKVVTTLSQVFMSVPSFFMGILVTLLFGIVLKVFSPGGYRPISEGFFGYLGFILFPAISIALPKIAVTVKFIKSSIKREKGQDYVRTAVAKGANDARVMNKHIFKNSLMPVITFVGLLAAEVLAGSILIEQVFNIPGIGRLLVSSIANRDFALVQGIILIIAVVVLTVNFIVDILYRVLDPRV